MLNKIASKYLLKVANPFLGGYDPSMKAAESWNLSQTPEQHSKDMETTKDVLRNIPKGMGDFVLNTADYTLKPAGRVGHKLMNTIWNAPLYSIPGLWNGKGYWNTYKNNLNAFNKAVDEDYQGVDRMIQQDQQSWDKAIPTTTPAGEFTRNTSELATAVGVGMAVGNTNLAGTAAVKDAPKVVGGLVKAIDMFGPDFVFEESARALDSAMQSKPKKLTPAEQYLLGLYGDR